MSYGTIMLDGDGDVITAEWPDGSETIGVALGAQQVAQSAALAVSLHRGSVWWNISAGVDYDGLFYQANRGDAAMNPARAAAFREAVLTVPGVAGFSRSNAVDFKRQGRTVKVNIACIDIACDESLVSASIQSLG